MSSDQENQIRAALGGSPSQTMAPATSAPPVQWQMPAPTPAATTPGTDSTPAAATAAMPTAADSREASLSELLMLYKSDKISPAEYQARRAKILSSGQ